MQSQDINNELYQNIRDARLQLHKLKQEAAALQADPYNQANLNMRQYMKNVAYSLSKNDQSMDKKFAQYKSKLPSIHKQDKPDIENSLIGGYKKYKKVHKNIIPKRNSQESTKADNSFSFSIQNRPMKIHSNYQKHYKPQISIIQGNQSQIIIPQQFLKLKQEVEILQREGLSRKQAVFSNNRRHLSAQKKKLKYVDLNSRSGIKQSDDILKPPAEMQYSSIVDKYSKHQFMIINGKLANDGPQYASYTRIYQSIFDRIKQEVSKLQVILKQKKINFARLDGKRLAYLCLKDQIKQQELIDCLVDENGQLKRILIPSSKYQGKKGKQLAATKIQSIFKMHVTRKKYILLRKKSIIIQRFFKKNLQRLKLQRQIHQRNTKILDNFQRRQQQLEQDWKLINKKKRIQIHLNSMEVDQQKRLSIENFQQRQNIQLSRIFRLRDQNVILIYISSSELSPELINYYHKMLELAGIPKYQDRLLFFTPNNASIFPHHFSVSKLLYYSSRTLKQLKIITQDLPTILFPGHPSNQLVKICDFLNCYLFSGAPQKIKPFTTRSQTLNFLKNLSIPCLPSAMEMYDYGEFLNTFSVLIIKNPEVKTWVFKIDDEFGGRGIGYLDTSRSKIIQSLLIKVNYGEVQNQMFATEITDVVAQPQNQQVIIKMRDYLRQNLPDRLTIATSSVYRSYSQFMGRFIKKGGVIQAKPPISNKQMLAFPSISFCVDPLGQFQIITTYQKIMGVPYRPYACSFPQKSLNIKQATTIIRQICQSFKIRKIFGFFTVDFITILQNQTSSKSKIGSKTNINNQKSPRLWVIDIDPYINNYTSSYFVFNVLMNGSFFPQKNIYLVEKQDQKSQTFSLDTMSSDHNSGANALVERGYIFLPHFYNQNMFKIKIKQFFKQARIERFNFDIGNKQGLCIMLLDSLTSGTMSILAASKNDQQGITLIKNVLDFIVRMSDVKNVNYGKTDSQPSTDRILVKDMLNLFLCMVKRDEKTNAKQKAIKLHQNNQNLNFIL